MATRWPAFTTNALVTAIWTVGVIRGSRLTQPGRKARRLERRSLAEPESECSRPPPRRAGQNREDHVETQRSHGASVIDDD